jgi:hypothetical protein
MHQESLSVGLVLRTASLVPLRAVGEHEGQLPWFCAFQSISPFALLAFTSFIAVGSEVARLRAGHRPPLKLYVQFSRIQLS